MNTNPESNNFLEELKELIIKYGIHKELKMPAIVLTNLLDATIRQYYGVQYEIDEYEAAANEELLKQNMAAQAADAENLFNSMPRENPNVW